MNCVQILNQHQLFYQQLQIKLIRVFIPIFHFRRNFLGIVGVLKSDGLDFELF